MPRTSVAEKRGLDINDPESSDLFAKDTGMPKKRHFRSRAHCNPLSHNDGFEYPLNPDQYDWGTHYPSIGESVRDVTILDIGMGFGGLTVALAEIYPKKLVLGMEIRPKVTEYVSLRIDALRKERPGHYENASCLRTNCMRHLPNFFKKGQMEKIFICFPDPHFKAKNFRRRIVTVPLCSEYYFLLKPGGRLYTITDVEELHKWHIEKCDESPLFQRIPDEEVMADDLGAKAMVEETEESKKVARLGGKKYFAVYERISLEEEEKLNVRPQFLKDLWGL